MNKVIKELGEKLEKQWEQYNSADTDLYRYTAEDGRLQQVLDNLGSQLQAAYEALEEDYDFEDIQSAFDKVQRVAEQLRVQRIKTHSASQPMFITAREMQEGTYTLSASSEESEYEQLIAGYK